MLTREELNTPEGQMKSMVENYDLLQSMVAEGLVKREGDVYRFEKVEYYDRVAKHASGPTEVDANGRVTAQFFDPGPEVRAIVAKG